MMDTSKDKKNILLQKSKEKNQSLEREKTIYDIINSEDLNLLYKKNAHLLACLSKTGKENTRLYSRLSSLTKQKSHLGDKNTVLKSKYLGLKEQISLFARQHREFNYQSQQLKEKLQKVKKIRIQKKSIDDISPEDLKQLKQENQLFKKKEQVYQKQIQNLQDLCKKKEGEKKAELKNLKKDHEKNFQSLEEKTQMLYQKLSVERNKKTQDSSPQIKKIKTINQRLSQKFKEMEKELKDKNKSYQLALRENEKLTKDYEAKVHKMKKLIGKRENEFNQKAEELKKNYEEKKIQLKTTLKKKENRFNQQFEKLKKEEQLIVQENEKIKVRKTEIQRLKKNEEDISVYKIQISELTKQKQKLKSGFTEQLNLFSKERDALKFQCENFKKALSAGKMGFDQAMLSFQRKYVQLYRERQELQNKVEEQAHQVQILKEQVKKSTKQFLKEKEDSENQIRRQKDKYISELCGELKASKEHNQDLENQIQNLKMESKNLFLKEKKQMQEEIKHLQWSKDQNLLHIEETHKKEMINLKSDYETRIGNMKASLNRKFQHIQIEMENDLCSEKKRHEVFKNMKMRQIQEQKDNLSLLQAQNHELKTKKFVLEKSLAETKENLDRYIRENKKWEEKNGNLMVLWQELQKQNETKDQQIQSLQKLNRSLSLSLNEKKEEKQTDNFIPNASLAPSGSFPDKENLKEKKPKSISHILADIHFD